ncbi:hypothetical protein SDC9_211788 [bioreactor metagenome]|uniref:Uncharacterized protein n=1 Tax=bioreactor metagenome TaxID=1076179 RepID=A0A645JMP3_9ZZZZ
MKVHTKAPIYKESDMAVRFIKLRKIAFNGQTTKSDGTGL